MKEVKDNKDETLGAGEKDGKQNFGPVIRSSKTIPKVSRVIFDEKTGTITLKLASEEEIAKANKQSQGTEYK